MITRQQIKEMVPHGYAKEIAKKAGVTPKAVSEYFSGKTNSKKVETATIEILEQIKLNRIEFNNRLIAAIN